MPPVEPMNPAQQAMLDKALAASKLASSAPASAATQEISETDNPKRMLFPATGPGVNKGIVAPRHMWEGYKSATGSHIDGMQEINKARAKVYGKENRDPLSIAQVGKIHKETLDEHFKKPISEQISAEKESLEKLRAARHINKNSNTLDESEKTDTAQYEPDPYYAWTSKGVAGHSVYTSGVGKNMKMHSLNTCPGQTEGCSGGVKNGVVDTLHGACFAPQAENQYGGASIRRACHEQAKHDPAMTKDWILAHTGSLREAANDADKRGQKTLFRPNVVDESDVSSRSVIANLNRQRKGKPKIIANSYGKGEELHDPENGYYITYSNGGPKTKLGASVSQNIKRDSLRQRRTITATKNDGSDYKNEQGNITPPLNSYFVTDVERYSPLDKRMQDSISHVKYWAKGRTNLTPKEKEQGDEGHYGVNEKGNIIPVPEKYAHFGHITLNGKRYDYQKQHVLHPREVSVPITKKDKKTGKETTSIKKMYTDSRFRDDQFLPSDEERYRSPNGKLAGAIVMTTPTTSTKGYRRKTGFYHHINEDHIEKAIANGGEHEIDPPQEQENSIGKEYVPPVPNARKAKAFGGAIDNEDDLESENMGLPEQNHHAQHHLSHHDLEDELHKNGVSSAVIDKAMKVVSHLRRR